MIMPPKARLTDDLTASEWWDRAACKGADTESFFPASASRVDNTLEEQSAKAHCRRCPVIHDCAEFAVTTGQHGIWGGMNDDERRLLRNQLGMHRGQR